MNITEFKNWALAQGGNIAKYNDGQFPGQCVSLVNQYCYRVLNVPASAWGDAKDWGANQATLAYFDIVSDIKQGDIVVYPSLGGGYGHIEVALNASWGIDQNGRAGTYRVGEGALYNVPKRILRKKGGNKPALEAHQRQTGSYGAKQRKSASLDGEHVDTITPNTVGNFKGFVHGEKVDGSDIWFVGQFSGLYSHSSGFTNRGVSGLKDLTVYDQVKPTERVVAYDGVQFRDQPNKRGVVKQTHNTGTRIDFKGWVNGEEIIFEGRKSIVWFVSKESGLFVSNLLMKDANAHDLANLNEKEPEVPTAPPEEKFPEPTKDLSIEAIVNKKHPVKPTNYKPADLFNIGSQSMRDEAAKAFNMMGDAMNKKKLSLTPLSGYRSFELQTTLYNNYVAKEGQEAADRYSARPGFSEHQLGLVMDVNNIDESFESTEEFKWLQANAHKYGFILRYPKGGEEITGYMYEPWHWRYIGTKIAGEFKKSKKNTLEELLGVEGGKYPVNPEPTKPTNTEKDKEMQKEVIDKGTSAIVDLNTITPLGSKTQLLLVSILDLVLIVGLSMTIYDMTGGNIPATLVAFAIGGLTALGYYRKGKNEQA